MPQPFICIKQGPTFVKLVQKTHLTT